MNYYQLQSNENKHNHIRSQHSPFIVTNKESKEKNKENFNVSEITLQTHCLVSDRNISSS